MATSSLGKKDRPAEIIGYAEPWIVAPSDTVKIKGVELEHSPPKVSEEVTAIPRQLRTGKFKQAMPGSYGYISDGGLSRSRGEEELEVSFYMQPWLLKCSHPQTLVSTLDRTARTGFSIMLNKKYSLEIWVGTGLGLDYAMLRTGLKPKKKTWSRVEVTIGRLSVQVMLTQKPLKAEPYSNLETGAFTREALVFEPGPLVIGAGQHNSPGGHGIDHRAQVCDFFNGRIDGLTLKTKGLQPSVLAEYDFSREMSSDRIIDVSGNGHNGVLINAPTRAVKGHDWHDESEPDWTKAKYGYGAIHFHEDDLDDANWEMDFTITVPPSARSGAYAVEVETTNGKDKDSITFFVRPTERTSDRSNKVCLVLPTFTYLAYANERLLDTSIRSFGDNFDIKQYRKTSEFYKMRRRRDLGMSLCDTHSDGSGNCLSSSKRPILNMRPGYVMWMFSRPREFSADLMMIGFLERERIPYEVLTDHDLHDRPASALQGFNTVITGSHPEYATLESLNAYIGYARDGGNLMYLGGNGFHLVSTLDVARPHRLEVRRFNGGIRTYTTPRGEHVNSLDGRRGGLWRSRGFDCNRLFGIGFSAQGRGPGVPYMRTEASRDARLAWMFTGVSEDLIGEDGFGGGASGDGIDRWDMDNSSSEGVLVLAESTVHSDAYRIAVTVEDLMVPASQTTGKQMDVVRSDLVYYIGTSGGAVFSVGSINWYCSLA